MKQKDKAMKQEYEKYAKYENYDKCEKYEWRMNLMAIENCFTWLNAGRFH